MAAVSRTGTSQRGENLAHPTPAWRGAGVSWKKIRGVAAYEWDPSANLLHPEL